MKVLIVNNMAPFVWGGAEELATHLKRNLLAHGHTADVLRIPFQWQPVPKIPTQMLLVRGIELENVDRVIGLQFPAYLIRHPQKTLWVLHQYRQAYDLYDAGHTDLEEVDGLRALIKSADEETFAECRQIFTNSEVTRRRLSHYNSVEAQVLMPPVNDPELFYEAPAEGYIFAGGRVNNMKRQRLLLEAFAMTTGRAKLVIAGPAEDESYAADLRTTIDRMGIADRVTLDIRFLPRGVYADYVRKASAVAYVPFDEDSLGYVAMEGVTARKPLLTTADSGGVLGLARDRETGWVAAPTAAALAEAMTSVFEDPARARTYGQAANELWRSMDISWPDTVSRLLR